MRRPRYIRRSSTDSTGGNQRGAARYPGQQRRPYASPLQTPGRDEPIAKITRKQLEDIAENKMSDLNAHTLDDACKILAGTARSMGVEVVE